MSLLTILRLCRIGENIIPVRYTTQTRNYAVDKKKTKSATSKVEILAEKDVNKLLTYVCGLNIYKEGEDIKLKPDSEYPEWLWSIRTEPLKLSDLEPNTKEYWKFIRRQGLKRKNQMMKYRKF